MKIGRDGVRCKSLLHCRNRVTEKKTAAAVTHVENDPALAGLEKERANVAFVIEHRNHGKVLVCVDISRTEFFQYQLFIGPLGAELPEVDHHRFVRESPG